MPEGTDRKFPLRQLQESNNMQNVQQDTRELLRLVESFPEHYDTLEGYQSSSAHDMPSSDDDLFAMLDLSRKISASLAEVISVRKRVVSGKVRERGGQRGDQAPRGQKRQAGSSRCDICDRTETPQWRPGPGGRGLLCNVCGLLYKKRENRRNLSMPDVSVPGS
ncbi:Uu.00g041610.m01.CDS01 [Anthostomella pinea]|uniref:Uu.00g041610.m01.CDS01 n=1 Tax=Anthostomella pinea TaxID=933095 RepID=A0AAI8V5G0_9PEZI|nr:Uu.00g041610.m01.CDS01 [Anthostomella pinea]